MTIYCKKVDSVVQKSGKFVIHDDKITTNPSEDLLKSLGYKEFVEKDTPEYDTNEQYLEEKITEYDDKIVKSYDIKQLEVEIDGEVPEVIPKGYELVTNFEIIGNKKIVHVSLIESQPEINDIECEVLDVNSDDNTEVEFELEEQGTDTGE